MIVRFVLPVRPGEHLVQRDRLRAADRTLPHLHGFTIASRADRGIYVTWRPPVGALLVEGGLGGVDALAWASRDLRELLRAAGVSWAHLRASVDHRG